MRNRSYEDQLHRASGLQLIISAIVIWNSIYISRAIETLRNNDIHISEEYMQHIFPLGWEHIALTGNYITKLPIRSEILVLPLFGGVFVS
nr:transposase [Bacillus cereus]